MNRALLIDAALLVALSSLCVLLSGLVEVSGKHPLEASALAVVFGIALRAAGAVPKSYRKSGRLGEALLGWGIVFLGASLNFASFWRNGPAILLIILCTMAAGYLVTLLLGRLWGLSDNLCRLLAVGTTICGGSAIAVIAPLLKAQDEETSYAIGTITLWGVLALLTYPLLGRLLNVDEVSFGLFAGVAIHSTPQVVGAAFLYSEAAGRTATAVKLLRNCFIAPLAFLFALKQRGAPADSVGRSGKSAFPWFLFGFFLLAAGNSMGLIAAEWAELLIDAAKFLIIIGMADVGLSTDLRALQRIGYGPLVVGFLGAVAVAAVAIGMVKFVG